jgi:hypothetical protein
VTPLAGDEEGRHVIIIRDIDTCPSIDEFADDFSVAK